MLRRQRDSQRNQQLMVLKQTKTEVRQTLLSQRINDRKSQSAIRRWQSWLKALAKVTTEWCPMINRPKAARLKKHRPTLRRNLLPAQKRGPLKQQLRGRKVRRKSVNCPTMIHVLIRKTTLEQTLAMMCLFRQIKSTRHKWSPVPPVRRTQARILRRKAKTTNKQRSQLRLKGNPQLPRLPGWPGTTSWAQKIQIPAQTICRRLIHRGLSAASRR